MNYERLLARQTEYIKEMIRRKITEAGRLHAEIAVLQGTLSALETIAGDEERAAERG